MKVRHHPRSRLHIHIKGAQEKYKCLCSNPNSKIYKTGNMKQKDKSTEGEVNI